MLVRNESGICVLIQSESKENARPGNIWLTVRLSEGKKIAVEASTMENFCFCMIFNTDNSKNCTLCDLTKSDMEATSEGVLSDALDYVRMR